ncbi:hypothetical protein GRI38_05915 [Altererythrobacter aurantiacus]|uniref:Lipoprotein n=1 Tax=Parapontixanthobacter aurantiacus TaxID=1463599 RepID=A0A844ZE89_9SPHN|nr:hypothetical protein [Parapontixanthobacter aurantiacus]MXO85562.1 hypothetical protein [Parapontixanthobacter aurantiacus]
MKKIGLAATVLAAFATSGCATLAAAGAGAAAATCLPEDTDCVEEVEDTAEDVADDI